MEDQIRGRQSMKGQSWRVLAHCLTTRSKACVAFFKPKSSHWFSTAATISVWPILLVNYGAVKNTCRCDGSKTDCFPSFSAAIMNSQETWPPLSTGAMIHITEECLLSCLAQTSDIFEKWASDNGSPRDDSLVIPCDVDLCLVGRVQATIEASHSCEA